MDHPGLFLLSEDFHVIPGILKMVHQVRLMMFSLKMVDYSMSMGGPRLLCQPQSPFGFIGVGTGLDQVGIGPGGIWD